MFLGIVILIICFFFISIFVFDVLYVGEEGCMDLGMDLIRLGSYIWYVKLYRKIDKY